MTSLYLALRLGAAHAVRPPPDYRATVGQDMSRRVAALNGEGRFEEALALVERFEKSVAPLPLVSYEAGYALNRLGKTEAAMAQYSAAIDGNPELASARDDRGELYMAQSRWIEARADFEVVTRVQPGHWAGHFRMAQLAGIAGDPKGLEAHLTQAIRTGFDLKILARDPAWRDFAKDPELASILRKIVILYTNESLLKDLGLDQ